MSNKMPPPPGVSPEALENIEQHDLDAANEAEPVAAPVTPKPAAKKRLKVRALRAGFIHQERKVENDKFEVYPNELGSWMECEDPVEQKRHLERLAAKKKKANQRGIEDQRRELADE